MPIFRCVSRLHSTICFPFATRKLLRKGVGRGFVRAQLWTSEIHTANLLTKNCSSTQILTRRVNPLHITLNTIVCAQMSTDDILWRNRGFPSCHLQHLPQNVRSDDDVTLTIDYARQSEVTSSFKKMVLEAAARGDNVGTDEYKEDMVDMLEFCEVFTARWANNDDHPSDDIAAFIVLGPSQLTRTLDPCIADLFVFRSRDVTDVTYIGLVRLAVELARLVDVGYTDCMMSVATSCCNLLTALRHEGFKDVVSLPRVVNMVDVGLTDAMLLMKNVGLASRPPRSVDEVISMLEKHKHTVPSDTEFLQATLPQVSFLPQQYKFKCGLETTLRQLRKDEAVTVWRMFKDSAERGEGYSIHLNPHLAFFRYRSVMKKTCVGIEDNSSGRLIGCLVVGPSCFARTPGIGDAAQVVAKDFQGRGVGSDIHAIAYGFLKQLYRETIFLFFANNLRSQKMVTSFEPTKGALGVIPHAAYFKGAGWTDLVLGHSDLKGGMDFTQLVAKNRQQAVAEPGDAKH